MVDLDTVKLGKKLATEAPPDPRNLKAENYIDLAALPDPIPDSIDWLGDLAFDIDGNDRFGDCVEAAAAHQEQAAAAANGQTIVITPDEVLAAYSAVTGFNPNDPATDEGTDPQAFLKYWQKTGIAGRRIGAYVSVDPTNDALVRAAMHLFGGLFIGVDLPASAKAQTGTAGLWDVVGDDGSGNTRPGTWGGHMIFGGRRRAVSQPNGVVTWGFVQEMSPAFLATYCFQQLFAVIPDAWLNDEGVAPNGIKIAELKRDLAIVSGQPDPGPAPEPTPTPTPERDAPPPLVPAGFDATLPFDAWLATNAPTLFTTVAAAFDPESGRGAVVLNWQVKLRQLPQTSVLWEQSMPFWRWLDAQPEAAAVLDQLAQSDSSGSIAGWVGWMRGQGFLGAAA